MNARLACAGLAVGAALSLGVIATLFWDSATVTMPPLPDPWGQTLSTRRAGRLDYNLERSSGNETFRITNQNQFAWTEIEVQVGDGSSPPFRCPVPKSLETGQTVSLKTLTCRSRPGVGAPKQLCVIGLTANEGSLTSAFEPCGQVQADTPHLRLGPVHVGVGTQETVMIPELRKHFTVRSILGGWEVRLPSERHPLVGISTESGRVTGVSFVWGPGSSIPTLEEMMEQLSFALPLESECVIENVAGPFEGGTVRTLDFACGGYSVNLSTGTYAQGNTASIHIEAK